MLGLRVVGGWLRSEHGVCGGGFLRRFGGRQSRTGLFLVYLLVRIVTRFIGDGSSMVVWHRDAVGRIGAARGFGNRFIYE